MLFQRKLRADSLLPARDQLSAVPSRDHQDILSSGHLLMIQIERTCNGCPEDLFMLLGQFPADTQGTVSQSVQQDLQRLLKPVRRLIQNDGPGLFLQLLKDGVPLLLL